MYTQIEWWDTSTNTGVPNRTAPQNICCSGYSWAGWQIFNRHWNLAGNLLLAKACWELWPILRSGWKKFNSSGWPDKLSPTLAGKWQDVTPRVHVLINKLVKCLVVFWLKFCFGVNLKTQNRHRSSVTVAVFWAVCRRLTVNKYSTTYRTQNWKTWSVFVISAVLGGKWPRAQC